MARKVTGPRPGEVRKYIPDVSVGEWSNRADADPVVAWIKNPTEADKRRVLSGYAKTQRIEVDKSGAPKAVEIGGDSQAWKREALTEFVDRVENYVGADGEPIATGARMFEHGEAGFVDDIVGEILTAFSLREEEKKSSSGQ